MYVLYPVLFFHHNVAVMQMHCQRKVRGKCFLEKSGRIKNWCHQMSDFQA